MSQQQQTNDQLNGDLADSLDQRTDRETLMRLLTQSELNSDQKDILQNLLVSDLVLANLSPAEVHEQVWRIRIARERFFGMHPPRGSVLAGVTRSIVNDDKTDQLTPLRPQDEEQLRAFFNILETRVTRSLDMEQQEILSPDIRENRAERMVETDEDSGGGLTGMLNR